ncbi:hypothetical protein GIB67_015744 [Kingdonia uniflora]|uniref:Uncharacterized protein n=1 Tax=Kingdonia uniflora TaxID=39325 RepID=A0A7J7NUY4_9MAGN|nr:hypothetical protein GIB67_015744 [Kingdonia uniflora]
MEKVNYQTIPPRILFPQNLKSSLKSAKELSVLMPYVPMQNGSHIPSPKLVCPRKLLSI